GELAGKIPGNVTVALDGNGVPYLKTDTVALGDGMSFAAWLAPSSRVSYDFSLSVQGNCGRHSSAKWILGMEALQEGSNAISALHFPMASKRQITLQSAATNVYRGDSNVKAQKPATKATNS